MWHIALLGITLVLEIYITDYYTHTHTHTRALIFYSRADRVARTGVRVCVCREIN